MGSRRSHVVITPEDIIISNALRERHVFYSTARRLVRLLSVLVDVGVELATTSSFTGASISSTFFSCLSSSSLPSSNAQNSFDSPLMSAHKTTLPTHAGLRYRSAGCALLNVCITKIVVASPAM